MNFSEERTSAGEWRNHWPLVLAALVGYMALGLQSYGFSPFVAHLEKAFGWSRTQVMLGVSVSNFVGIFLNIIVGLIVDRVGSRRVGLAGLVIMTGSFGLLGTATGSQANWVALWLLIALGVVLTQATVWTRAIASFFDKSRGSAMAVALCGAPLAAVLVPLLASNLIEIFGWRIGFFGVAACWLGLALPVVYFLFHDREAPRRRVAAAVPAAPLPGYSFAEGLRTKAFVHLLISFGCFSFYSMTVATNLVPILTESGISAMQAAAVASIMGIVGIVSRLSVGLLLDRFSGPAIGATTLLLPVIGCAILLMDQPSLVMLMISVAVFGAAIGAEVDVALYLATRHFGLKSFAALFSAIITYGAVNATAGPLIAGWLYDVSGDYDYLLMTMMVVMIIGALFIGTIGAPRRQWQQQGPADVLPQARTQAHQR